MTSRNYIYNRARSKLKSSAFPLLNESQVVIDVIQLSIEERRQILYNHLRLGRQTQQYRSRIKPFLELAARHDRFTPEMARRLSDPIFTKAAILSPDGIEKFVGDQTGMLAEVLTNLDDDSRAALALLYMRNGHLQSPILLSEPERDAIDSISSTHSGRVIALQALEGSLVSKQQIAGEVAWVFRHPTISDAYAENLKANPELLEIFVRGSPVEELLSQVTCGDVGIRGAVIVPQSLFKLLADRVSEFFNSARVSGRLSMQRTPRELAYGFLERRSSKQFCQLFLAENKSILDDIAEPGLMLEAVPEVSLALALHKRNALPESTRAAFVASVIEYTAGGDDFLAITDADFRSIFTAREELALLEQVKVSLIPNLYIVRSQWQQSRSFPRQRRSDDVAPLLDGLRSLAQLFDGDDVVLRMIRNEEAEIQYWIDEDDEEDSGMTGPLVPRLVIPEPTAASTSSRSIFDDVDQ